jgi:hypothetical protein
MLRHDHTIGYQRDQPHRLVEHRCRAIESTHQRPVPLASRRVDLLYRAGNARVVHGLEPEQDLFLASFVRERQVASGGFCPIIRQSSGNRNVVAARLPRSPYRGGRVARRGTGTSRPPCSSGCLPWGDDVVLHHGREPGVEESICSGIHNRVHYAVWRATIARARRTIIVRVRSRQRAVPAKQGEQRLIVSESLSVTLRSAAPSLHATPSSATALFRLTRIEATRVSPPRRRMARNWGRPGRGRRAAQDPRPAPTSAAGTQQSLCRRAAAVRRTPA